MSELVMVDLFSGLGGASQAMFDRGWTVHRVELNEAQRPDVVADVRYLPIKPPHVDLLWASPPCLGYSRYDQPWFQNEPKPSIELWEATERAISELRPRFWIIENTRGARKVHGKDSVRFGSHFLWSNLPLWPAVAVERTHKWGRFPSGTDRTAQRAKIPYPLSLALAELIEVCS